MTEKTKKNNNEKKNNTDELMGNQMFYLCSCLSHKSKKKFLCYCLFHLFHSKTEMLWFTSQWLISVQ